MVFHLQDVHEILPNSSFGKDIVVFGADMILSVHVNNKIMIS